MPIAVAVALMLDVRRPDGTLDVDKINIQVDSDGYAIWFQDPSILRTGDGKPLSNPWPLQPGENIFQRAHPEVIPKERTGYHIGPATTSRTAVIVYSHPIPPHP